MLLPRKDKAYFSIPNQPMYHMLDGDNLWSLLSWLELVYSVQGSALSWNMTSPWCTQIMHALTYMRLCNVSAL